MGCRGIVVGLKSRDIYHAARRVVKSGLRPDISRVRKGDILPAPTSAEWRRFKTWYSDFCDKKRAQDVRSNDPTEEQVSAFIARHPNGAELEEIAEVFGMSKQTICEIEQRALDKLRRAGRLDHWKDTEKRDPRQDWVYFG